MKKSVIISVIILLLVCIATNVNAYSTSDYSIDVPASFKEFGTAIYKMDNGNNFNVQVTNYDEKKDGYPYTQKTLDDLVQQMEKSGANVKKKEITNCTKNNYKCIHLMSGIYGYTCDQYAIFSGNKIYTITVTVADEKDLENSDVKAIVDTFTLKDYKEPKQGFSPILIGAIIGAGVGLLLGIIAAIKKKKEKAQ